MSKHSAQDDRLNGELSSSPAKVPKVDGTSEDLSQEERIARVKDFFSKSGSKGMMPPVIRPKPKPKPAKKPSRDDPKENTTPTSPISPGAAEVGPIVLSLDSLTQFSKVESFDLDVVVRQQEVLDVTPQKDRAALSQSKGLQNRRLPSHLVSKVPDDYTERRRAETYTSTPTRGAVTKATVTEETDSPAMQTETEEDRQRKIMAKAGVSQSNPLAALGSILRGKGGRNSFGRGKKSGSLTDSPILKQKSTESPRFFRKTSEPPPTATPPKSPRGFKFGLRRSSSRSKKGNHLEPGTFFDDTKSETVSVSSLNVQSTFKEEEAAAPSPMETQPSATFQKDTSALDTSGLSTASNSVSPLKSESPVSPPPAVPAAVVRTTAAEATDGPTPKKPARDSILFKEKPEVESLFSEDSNLFGSSELDALFGKERAKAAREKTPEHILEIVKRKRERTPEKSLDKPEPVEQSQGAAIGGGRGAVESKAPEQALDEIKKDKPILPKPSSKPAREDGSLKARMQMYEARYKASREKEEMPVATSTPSKDVLSSSPKRTPYSFNRDKPATEPESSPKRAPFAGVESSPRRTYGKTPPEPSPKRKPFSLRSAAQDKPEPMDTTKEKSKSPEPVKMATEAPAETKNTLEKPKATTVTSPRHNKDGGLSAPAPTVRKISDILAEAVEEMEKPESEEAAEKVEAAPVTQPEKKPSLFEDVGDDESTTLFSSTTKVKSPLPQEEKPKTTAEKKKASLFEDDLFQDDFKPKERIAAQKVDIFGSKKDVPSPTRKPFGSAAKEGSPIRDDTPKVTPPHTKAAQAEPPVKETDDSALFGERRRGNKESSPAHPLEKSNEEEETSSRTKDIFGRSKRTLVSPERETSPKDSPMEVEASTSSDFSVERRTNLFGEPLDDFKKTKVNGIEDTDSILFGKRHKESQKLEDSDELEADIFSSRDKTADLSKETEEDKKDEDVKMEVASEDPLGAIKTEVQRESEEREGMKKASKDSESALEDDIITSSIDEEKLKPDPVPSAEITISPESKEKAAPSEDTTVAKADDQDTSKTEEAKEEKEEVKKSTRSRAETARSGGSSARRLDTKDSRLDTKDSSSPRARSRTALDTGRSATDRKSRVSSRDDKKEAAKPSWMLELQKKKDLKKDDKPLAKSTTASSTTSATTTSSAGLRRREREIPAWQREILDRKNKTGDSGKTSSTAAKTTSTNAATSSTRGTRSPRLGRASPTSKSPTTGRRTPTKSPTSKSPGTTRSALGAGRRSPRSPDLSSSRSYRSRQKEELEKSSDSSSLGTISERKAGSTAEKKEGRFTTTSKKVESVSKPKLLTKKPSIEISVRSSTSKSESSDSGKPEIVEKPSSPIEKKPSDSEQKDKAGIDDTKLSVRTKSQSDGEEDDVFRSKSPTPSDELDRKAAGTEKEGSTKPVEKVTGSGSRQSSISSDRDGERVSRSSSHSRSGSSTPTKSGKLSAEATGVPEWKKKLMERKKSGSGPPPKSPKREAATKEPEAPSWKKELLAKKKTRPGDEKSGIQTRSSRAMTTPSQASTASPSSARRRRLEPQPTPDFMKEFQRKKRPTKE